jgi:hypothetical protein
VVGSDNRANDARGALAAKAAGKKTGDFDIKSAETQTPLAELLHDRSRFADRQGLTDEDWSVAQSNVARARRLDL